MIIMDTTYLNPALRVVVFRDWYQRKNILWYFISEPENAGWYRKGIAEIQASGGDVLGIVADGRKGVLGAFGGIPVQMCHFHQKKIVQRYVTNSPKLYPGKELLLITNHMSKVNLETFELLLDTWYDENEEFISEKHLSFYTGRPEFVHRRLRSAYFSLKHNLPYLYTYQKYPKLSMTHTTNSLESIFGHLKQKANLHRGLRLDRRLKLLGELLSSR